MPATCPVCSHQGPPIVTQQVSTGGWIVFAVLLVTCFPLCWIPFVVDGLKEEVRRCGACGCKMGVA